MIVINGRITVAVAGRAVPLGPAGGALIPNLLIEAPEANTSAVCVGASSVVALLESYNSPELHPGDHMWLHGVILSEVYVDVRTDDDAIVFRGTST